MDHAAVDVAGSEPGGVDLLKGKHVFKNASSLLDGSARKRVAQGRLDGRPAKGLECSEALAVVVWGGLSKRPRVRPAPVPFNVGIGVRVQPTETCQERLGNRWWQRLVLLLGGQDARHVDARGGGGGCFLLLLLLLLLRGNGLGWRRHRIEAHSATQKMGKHQQPKKQKKPAVRAEDRCGDHLNIKVAQAKREINSVVGAGDGTAVFAAKLTELITARWIAKAALLSNGEIEGPAALRAVLQQDPLLQAYLGDVVGGVVSATGDDEIVNKHLASIAKRHAAAAAAPADAE